MKPLTVEKRVSPIGCTDYEQAITAKTIAQKALEKMKRLEAKYKEKVARGECDVTTTTDRAAKCVTTSYKLK